MVVVVVVILCVLYFDCRGIFGDPGHRDNYYYVEPTNEGTSVSVPIN